MAGDSYQKYALDLSEKKTQKCPHVRIHLNLPAKSLNYEEPFFDLDIFQSLEKRQKILDKKISNKRMTHKASIISQMRQVPEINKNSRKIMENKTPESALKLKFDSKKKLKRRKKLKNSEKKNGRTKPDSILSNPMSANIFKHSQSLELAEVSFSPPSSQKTVVARLKEWDEQREKRLADKQKQKEIEDMLECTFSPQLSLRLDVSQSSTKNEGFSLRPISPKIEYLTEVKPIDCEYCQISPVVFKVAYLSGYNREDFLSRAMPVARYENSDTDSDILE